MEYRLGTCDCGHVKQTLDVLSLKFHETRCRVATTPKERFESSFRLDHMYKYEGFYERAPNEITRKNYQIHAQTNYYTKQAAIRR